MKPNVSRAYVNPDDRHYPPATSWEHFRDRAAVWACTTVFVLGAVSVIAVIVRAL